jgi:hypothetical protein
MTIKYEIPAKPSIPLFEKSSDRTRTFASFIQSARVTNSPRGDFISDTKTLIDWGKLPAINSWRDLHSFMFWKRHACPEAIAEGRKLWREYQKLKTAAVPPAQSRGTAS